MGMRRRQWFRAALGAAAALGAPWLGLVRRSAPVRYVEAIRARFYPGARKALNRSELTKPGHWKG